MVNASDSHTVMLPTSLKNPRKKPFTSEPIAMGIPESVPAASEKMEKAVVFSLFSELNDLCGLSLDTNPDMNRGMDPATRADNTKLIAIGASHMCRIVEQLLPTQVTIASHCTPGWSPSPDSINEAAVYLADQNPTRADIVAIDLWSNSAFMGTDSDGLPYSVFRDTEGRYHLPGGLQAAPKSVFQKILSSAKGLVDAAGDAAICFMLPLARYINTRCCEDPEHLVNFATDDLGDEVHKAADNAMAALSAVFPEMSHSTLSLSDVFGYDKDFFSMVTSSGSSIWLDHDGVHLTPDAYLEIGKLILAGGDAGSGGHHKRARLDSVVPGPPPKRGKTATVPPTPWVAGGCPTHRGRGGRAWGRAGFGGRAGAMRGRGRGGAQGPYGRPWNKWIRGGRGGRNGSSY